MSAQEWFDVFVYGLGWPALVALGVVLAVYICRRCKARIDKEGLVMFIIKGVLMLIWVAMAYLVVGVVSSLSSRRR